MTYENALSLARRGKSRRLLLGGAVLTVALANLQCVHETGANAANEQGSSAPSGAQPQVSVQEPLRSPESYVASGAHGVAAGGCPEAAAAGVEILKLGGNAIDAAVATSFVSAVCQPQSTGLGGGGFMLVRPSPTRENPHPETVALDFRGRVPKAATRDMYLDAQKKPKKLRTATGVYEQPWTEGPLSADVPSNVAGFIEASERFGHLPLKTVIAPAIRVAEDGFVVYKFMADAIAYKAETLKRFPDTRKLLFPNGQPLKVGDRLRQPDLARTLRLIADKGRKGFYEGAFARHVVEESTREGGILSLEDLRTYKVITRKPLVGSYRGHRIETMPPPSSGVHILELLNVLDQARVARMPPFSPERLFLLTETLKHVYADRAQYLGDPAFTRVPVQALTDPAYAAGILSKIDPHRATPGKDVKAGVIPHPESGSTSNIIAAAADGSAAVTTHSVNLLFGSCFIPSGTGVFLNDDMDDFAVSPGAANRFGLTGGEANAIAPGKTAASSMSPTFVYDEKGGLMLGVGSAGGSRIITSIAEVLLDVVDYGMGVKEAVFAPRIHHQWTPDELLVEAPLPKRTQDELRARGETVVEKPASFADVSAFTFTPGVGFAAAADPRRNGGAAGY